MLQRACFAGEEVRLQRNALVVLSLPQGTEPVRALDKWYCAYQW